MSASPAHASARGRPVNIREAKRTPTFDGVRGICAVALLIVHVAWVARLIGNYNQPPSFLPGATLVNGFQVVIGIFFLMSGMFLFRPFARAIIAGTKRPALGEYFLRRALRLLPPYYIMLAAALLLLNFNSITSVWYVLRPIVLMQNYNSVWMAGMDISWTVPTEVQWYLALPLIAWAVAWYARKGATPAIRARRLMIPVPVLLAAGLGWFIYLHQPGMGIFPLQYWYPISMAGAIGVGLMMGIMSALSQVSPDSTPTLFRLGKRWPNLFWLGALAIFAIDCAQIDGRLGYSDWPTMTGGLVYYACFVVFAVFVVTPMIAPGAHSRLINAVLGNMVTVYIGRISYGIFLWHFTIMNLYLRNGSIFGGSAQPTPALRGKAGFWELEAAVLFGTILVATLSYYLLERPVIQLGDRWMIARKAARTAAAPVVGVPATGSTEVPVTARAQDGTFATSAGDIRPPEPERT